MHEERFKRNEMDQHDAKSFDDTRTPFTWEC